MLSIELKILICFVWAFIVFFITALIIGNEGKGLTDQASQAADCLIRIPMNGQVESLNAAMAAGILMYEAARQRR